MDQPPERLMICLTCVRFAPPGVEITHQHWCHDEPIPYVAEQRERDLIAAGDALAREAVGLPERIRFLTRRRLLGSVEAWHRTAHQPSEGE